MTSAVKTHSSHQHNGHESFSLGKPSKDKNPKSINSSSRKWDGLRNSSKSSSNSRSGIYPQYCKILSEKSRLINTNHNFQNSQFCQIRAFSQTDKFYLFSAKNRLPEKISDCPTIPSSYLICCPDTSARSSCYPNCPPLPSCPICLPT